MAIGRKSTCKEQGAEGSEAIGISQGLSIGKLISPCLNVVQILLKSSERARFEPSKKRFSLAPPADQGYPMEPPQTPPPVYNPDPPAPPGYAASPDTSKPTSSQNWMVPPTGAPPTRSPDTDVEQGMTPDGRKTTPVKGGQFQKLVGRISGLPPFNR